MEGKGVRRMRLKKFTVTFSSFGFLLLVNVALAFADDATIPSTKGYEPLPTPQKLETATQMNHSQTQSTIPFHNQPEPPVQFHTHSQLHYDSDHHEEHPYENANEEHQQDGPSGATSGIPTRNLENCRLPDSWKGRWFQSGVLAPILIDGKSIAEKGTCYESSGDKFLFVNKTTNCHRCVVINERHHNVLQYKESECEGRNNLERLCNQIPGDAQLYSLFRIDAQFEECPFKAAPYTFVYNRGYGDCKNPVSYVDTCTENSRLLLRYQACPDVPKTESTLEELTCLAQWKEASHHYLVGILSRGRMQAAMNNEDSYRCFVFEKTKDGHNGYKVAQSGDASCSGVSSPTEGARTLIFTKVDKGDIKCTFPRWLTTHHWYTLDGKMSTKIHNKNSTMHITEDNRRNSSGHYSHGGSSSAGNSYKIPSSLFTGGTRIACQQSVNISPNHVALVAQHTEGCKTETICMHLYKRANHVVEVQMLRKSDQSEDFECGRALSLGPKQPYVTLISAEAKSHRCPNLGKYSANGVSQDGRVVRDTCGPSGQGAFHSLVVGCDDRATMEFHSKCTTQEPITSYECHGSWEENGTGYLIASPLSRSSTSARRYCFIYSETEDGGLRVSSSSESCRRNMSPGVEGVWAFNLTIDGQCAEAVTGAVSRFRACDVLISVVVLSVIFMTVCNCMLVAVAESSWLTRNFFASALQRKLR